MRRDDDERKKDEERERKRAEKEKKKGDGKQEDGKGKPGPLDEELVRETATDSRDLPAQREDRERKVAHAAAKIFDERKIEQRFDGKGWSEIGVDEKLELVRAYEEQVRRIEGRQKCEVVAVEQADLPRLERSDFRDGQQELRLDRKMLEKGGAPKEVVMGEMLKQQARAVQADMVGWRVIQDDLTDEKGAPAERRWASEFTESQEERIAENYRPENRITPGETAQERLLYQQLESMIHAKALTEERYRRVTATNMGGVNDEEERWR